MTRARDFADVISGQFDLPSGSLDNAIAEVSDDTTPQLGGDLDVQTNSIVSTSNQDINITPNGTGSVVIDGLSHPQADGTAGQFLKTDGSGSLSFATVATSLSGDSSPQLGGQLDVNGNAIGDGTNELLAFSETASAVNEFTIANAATGAGPTLSSTGSDTNIDINITPKGTGNIVLDGLSFPNADGTSGQFLKTDGSGALSFGDAGGLSQLEHVPVTKNSSTHWGGGQGWATRDNTVYTFTSAEQGSRLAGVMGIFADITSSYGNRYTGYIGHNQQQNTNYNNYIRCDLMGTYTVHAQNGLYIEFTPGSGCYLRARAYTYTWSQALYSVPLFYFNLFQVG